MSGPPPMAHPMAHPAHPAMMAPPPPPPQMQQWLEARAPDGRPYWCLPGTQESRWDNPNAQPMVAPPPATERWKVVAPNGVALRASADFNNRIDSLQGPTNGVVVEGILVTGAGGMLFVQDAGGHFIPVRDTKGTILLTKIIEVHDPLSTDKKEAQPTFNPASNSNSTTAA